MSEPPRFGTSDEIYELMKEEKAQRVALSRLRPIMTDEMATTHHHSVTRRPIIVDRCSKRVLDGNHRFWEAFRRGERTIEAYMISPYVQDYKDYEDGGKWKVRSVDKPCPKSSAAERRGLIVRLVIN